MPHRLEPPISPAGLLKIGFGINLVTYVLGDNWRHFRALNMNATFVFPRRRTRRSQGMCNSGRVTILSTVPTDPMSLRVFHV